MILYAIRCRCGWTADLLAEMSIYLGAQSTLWQSHLREVIDRLDGATAAAVLANHVATIAPTWRPNNGRWRDARGASPAEHGEPPSEVRIRHVRDRWMD